MSAELLEALHVVSGIVLLLCGAELLVRNARLIGLHFGLEPLLVGATIVAFGTSAPELLVSIVASIEGAPGLALGNLLGSNVANITLVLGVTAAIRAVPVQRRIVRREYLICLLATLAVAAFVFLPDLAAPTASRPTIGRVEGAVLLLLFAWFFWVYTRDALRRPPDPEELAEARAARRRLPKRVVILAVMGLGVLLLGSEMVVTGGGNLARNLGVSPSLVGASLLAIGTSLPELATTAVAAYRGESDMALGNVVGSNVFNLLFVLGPVALISPFPVEPVDAHLLLPLMVGSTLVLGGMLAIGSRITRPEGCVLLLGFVLYLAALVRES